MLSRKEFDLLINTVPDNLISETMHSENEKGEIVFCSVGWIATRLGIDWGERESPDVYGFLEPKLGISWIGLRALTIQNDRLEQEERKEHLKYWLKSLKTLWWGKESESV